MNDKLLHMLLKIKLGLYDGCTDQESFLIDELEDSLLLIRSTKGRTRDSLAKNSTDEYEVTERAEVYLKHLYTIPYPVSVWIPAGSAPSGEMKS